MQKLVVVAVLGSILLFGLVSLVQMTAYAAHTSILAYFWTLQDLAVPLLLFAVAYLLNPKKQAVLHRAFESSLITILGVLLISVASLLTNSLYSILVINQGGNYDSHALYQMLPQLIVLVIFVVTLVYLRQTKRWK